MAESAESEAEGEVAEPKGKGKRKKVHRPDHTNGSAPPLVQSAYGSAKPADTDAMNAVNAMSIGAMYDGGGGGGGGAA